MKSVPPKLALDQETIRILTSKASARAVDTTLPICPTGIVANGRKN